MTLKLINNLTKSEQIYNEIEDKLDSQLFYHFEIALTDDVLEGEYTYELYEEDELKAQGLLQVGDYERDMNINKEYKDNNDKKYIVYGE